MDYNHEITTFDVILKTVLFDVKVLLNKKIILKPKIMMYIVFFYLIKPNKNIDSVIHFM